MNDNELEQLKLKKICIVIPCKSGSTRLIRKHFIPLINGKYISQMTWEVCNEAIKDFPNSSVVIGTPDEEMVEHVKKWGAKSIITKGSTNGTEAMAIAARQLPDFDFFVNVQGDEPLMNYETVKEVIYETLRGKNFLTTARTPFESLSEAQNHNNVKVLINNNNQAIYFSRSLIPFTRDLSQYPEDEYPQGYPYWKHLGIYGYHRDNLESYLKLNPTPLSVVESLEQLRVLENGLSIGLVDTKFDSIGIDTQETLDELNTFLKQNQKP